MLDKRKRCDSWIISVPPERYNNTRYVIIQLENTGKCLNIMTGIMYVVKYAFFFFGLENKIRNPSSSMFN